jgi:hypothetical protein
MRWVVKVTNHDRTYYYFRRKPWPEARNYGEPRSPEFETCYQSLLAALTVRRGGADPRSHHEEAAQAARLLRSRRHPRVSRKTTTDTGQAQHVYRALGIPLDELLE